jgi:peroxiredoxin
MPEKKSRIITRKKPSAEGEAMAKAFKTAMKKAERLAFTVRKTIMVEKDGWLVMVNKEGKVMKKVKKLEPLVLPPN